MVTTRKRALTAETPASPRRRSSKGRRRGPSPPQDLGGSREGSEGYEKVREDRIRENIERMQNLGILDLSLKLKRSRSRSLSLSRSQPQLLSLRCRSLARSLSSDPTKPPRRSSRLQNVTPVTYAEVPVKKFEDTVRNRSGSIEEGQKEEFYTDEHDKLLGTCEMNWTLFVDGYGSDGNRVYDQIKGKTCHQCRQKTLGYRTHCGKCNMVQGQFCGDCLYTRYGENVLEAKKDPDWTCPVCRGICNCSLCRIKKGWAPTGPLYKKVLNLGFKSVAHYLIQTRRRQTSSGGQDSSTQPSSKKSLPFTVVENSSRSNDTLWLKTISKLVPCDKNNSACNGRSGSQSAGKHTVSNAVADDKTVKHGNQSASRKEGTVAVKTDPDCVASRLRKRHDKAC